MHNLTLLALDTSTEACSVALLYKGERTYLDELAQRTHTQRILPMIDEILCQSGLSLKQVDALALTGPRQFYWRASGCRHCSRLSVRSGFTGDSYLESHHDGTSSL